MDVPTITREALKEKIERREPVVIVETLSTVSFAKDHLPGAVNLPPDRIAELAPSVLPDKAADIVVYCASPT